MPEMSCVSVFAGERAVQFHGLTVSTYTLDTGPFIMADANPAQVVVTSTSNEIPIPVDDVTPAQPQEFASETLYIQNLNEKIRIDG